MLVKTKDFKKALNTLKDFSRSNCIVNFKCVDSVLCLGVVATKILSTPGCKLFVNIDSSGSLLSFSARINDLLSSVKGYNGVHIQLENLQEGCLQLAVKDPLSETYLRIVKGTFPSILSQDFPLILKSEYVVLDDSNTISIGNTLTIKDALKTISDCSNPYSADFLRSTIILQDVHAGIRFTSTNGAGLVRKIVPTKDFGTDIYQLSVKMVSIPSYLYKFFCDKILTSKYPVHLHVTPTCATFVYQSMMVNIPQNQDNVVPDWDYFMPYGSPTSIKVNSNSLKEALSRMVDTPTKDAHVVACVSNEGVTLLNHLGEVLTPGVAHLGGHFKVTYSP